MTDGARVDQLVEQCWRNAFQEALAQRGDPVWACATADGVAHRRYGRFVARDRRRQMQREAVIEFGVRLLSLGTLMDG